MTLGIAERLAYGEDPAGQQSTVPITSYTPETGSFSTNAEAIDSLHLLDVRLGAPASVVVLGHVEEPERDHPVLVADVPGVMT